MATELKIGDIVRLRSGGAAMTVVRVTPVQGAVVWVECIWLDREDRVAQWTFDARLLMVRTGGNGGDG